MANVNLSIDELKLVTDASVILTKNRIMARVYDLFGELAASFRQWDAQLPAEVTAVQPKISRGENYQGLPWVMLDYPRRFSKNEVFAVRCFFWWGHFFSISLQLQGEFSNRFAPRLQQYLSVHPDGWWICINADPWAHHFEPDNFRPYSPSDSLAARPFIKLAKKIPLTEWDKAFDFMGQGFSEIMAALGTEPVK